MEAKLILCPLKENKMQLPLEVLDKLNVDVGSYIFISYENDMLFLESDMPKKHYLLNEIKAQAGDKYGDVRFWTFHKAKGLEADHVILVGLTQGRMGFPREQG